MIQEKSQDVRLFDVMLLGPFMIWFGMRSTRMPTVARTIMVVAGIGTILYNASTYRADYES